MTVKLSSLAVATNLDGNWEDSTSFPGVSFLVRSINYPAFAIARDHLMQRLRRKHGDSIPPDVISPSLGRLLAEHILLGWKGLDEEYSAERARECLTDPSYYEVVQAVLTCSNMAAAAKIEYVGDAAKN